MNAHAELRQRYRSHLGTLLDRVTRAITGLPAGRQRLLLSIESYWEACLDHRAQRIGLYAAAASDELMAVFDQQARIFERMIASELTACGVREPHALGRRLFEEVRSIARAEQLSGERAAAQRQAFADFLDQRLALALGGGNAAVTQADPPGRHSGSGRRHLG